MRYVFILLLVLLLLLLLLLFLLLLALPPQRLPAFKFRSRPCWRV